MTAHGDDAARTRGPVLVVGTGLIGTSVGLGLRAAGVAVQLCDASPSAAALARDLGAGDLRTPASPDPELVVVAAPPDVVAGVVADQLAAWPQAVVTDVASVKAVIAQHLAQRAQTHPGIGVDALARYVGGHPLAGRERSGAVAGRGDLFTGRPWVLCPTAVTSPAALARVRDLADDLGATSVVLDAADHDEAVALVSHVPQVAASLVAARLRAAPEAAVALAGQGVRDVTRIAASDPALWVQILGSNAAPVAAVLRAMRDDLDAVVDALDALAASGDALGARGVIAAAIESGGEGRARIPGKHGSPPTSYAVVTVLVPDAPGELARLLGDTAAAGVNLEELRLEHSPGQLVGLADISVMPAARPRLEEALGALGWVLES